MRLKPKKNFGSDFLKLYDKAMRNVVVTSKRDPSRLLHLRCSQLPFCALSFFTNVAINPYSQSLDFMGLYYTTVGTAVHTVMQTALMQSSDQIVGDWLCRECGTIKKFTVQSSCCGFPMQYEELNIDYRGIQGHIDTIFLTSKLDRKKKLRPQLKNGKYWIVDYKTTSEKAKKTKSKSPGSAYIEQVMSYAYLLQKQYGIVVEGVMLVFIPRDNPKSPVVWSQVMTDSDFKKIRDKLKTYKLAHRRVMAATTLKDVLSLVDDFGTCNGPYCNVCTVPNVRDRLTQAYRLGKQYLPLKDFIKKA